MSVVDGGTVVAGVVAVVVWAADEADVVALSSQENADKEELVEGVLLFSSFIIFRAFFVDINN